MVRRRRRSGLCLVLLCLLAHRPVQGRRRRAGSRGGEQDGEGAAPASPRRGTYVPHEYEGGGGRPGHGPTEDLLRIYRHSLHPDLLDALRREAVVAHEMNTQRTQRQSKYTTNWMDLEGADGSTAAARSATEAAILELFALAFPGRSRADTGIVGAEWWYQLKGAGDGITYHYDKDEAMSSDRGVYRFPLLSTVTYLTDDGGPTLVANVSGEPGSFWHRQERAPLFLPSAAVIWPEANKHLIFRGDLYHGVEGRLSAAQDAERFRHAARLEAGCDPAAAPAGDWTWQELELEREPPWRRGAAGLPSARATFLVNWWQAKPAPPNLRDVDDDDSDRLARSHGADLAALLPAPRPPTAGAVHRVAVRESGAVGTLRVPYHTGPQRHISVAVPPRSAFVAAEEEEAEEEDYEDYEDDEDDEAAALRPRLCARCEPGRAGGAAGEAGAPCFLKDALLLYAPDGVNGLDAVRVLKLSDGGTEALAFQSGQPKVYLFTREPYRAVREWLTPVARRLIDACITFVAHKADAAPTMAALGLAAADLPAVAVHDTRRGRARVLRRGDAALLSGGARAAELAELLAAELRRLRGAAGALDGYEALRSAPGAAGAEAGVRGGTPTPDGDPPTPDGGPPPAGPAAAARAGGAAGRAAAPPAGGRRAGAVPRPLRRGGAAEDVRRGRGEGVPLRARRERREESGAGLRARRRPAQLPVLLDGRAGAVGGHAQRRRVLRRGRGGDRGGRGRRRHPRQPPGHVDPAAGALPPGGRGHRDAARRAAEAPRAGGGPGGS